MSFNQKAIYSSFFIIALIFGSGILYYKKSHPKYVPPVLRPEVVVTIIPGWNLRQVAEYLVKQGIASSTDDVYKFTGEPAVDYRVVASIFPKIEDLLPSQRDDPASWRWKILAEKPAHVSYEGYLAPETYRIFKDATILDVLKKLVAQREKEITPEIWSDIKKSGRSFYEILIMASLLEEEVQSPDDKAKVADILWRRYQKNWALQVDSSVHYAINKTGTVFTTEKERKSASPWNTYKYSGLPLGPISNPELDSIKAALYPEKNSYWYFLTGKDGTVYYAGTLDEHNANKSRL